MLKITHRIESTAGHFVRTVRQDNEGMGRWEIIDESSKVIADSGDEQLALIEAKRQVYKLDIARLELIKDTDNRISILLEMLNEELTELTNQALTIV
jgi:hypothetical protein